MRLFRRRDERDLVIAHDLGRYGRYKVLGPDLADLGAQDPFALVEPLVQHVHGVAPDVPRVLQELRRHAEGGPWPAVGAWKFADEFMGPEESYADVTSTGLRALVSMRIRNLGYHLSPRDVDRYLALFGEPPPNDGFAGPPVFDSEYGPSRQFYVDQAVAAAAARRPMRVTAQPGVAPGDVSEAVRSFWNLGLLVLRGPLLISPDIRFEPAVVRPAVAAAEGVDHGAFAERVLAAVREMGGDMGRPWTCMGAARFVEDYLSAELTGSPVHVALIDEGLAFLFGATVPSSIRPPAQLLTPVERDRVTALGLSYPQVS